MSEILKNPDNMYNKQRILNFCLQEGYLVDKFVLEGLEEIGDFDLIKGFINKIKRYGSNKIINQKIFLEYKKEIYDFLINFGESSEIDKIVSFFNLSDKIIVKKKKELNNISISSLDNPVGKKLEVSDFVTYFRSRFSEMKDFLQNYSELTNLVSISKISGNKQGVSIIGMILSKKITKNNNILFEVEDLTGKIKVLVNVNNNDLYKKAEDVALDSVLGFKGSGSDKIFFVNDIVFPDSRLSERKISSEEECAVFIGDLHFGSKKFLEKNFLNFIDYLNREDEEAKKIRYLFIIGDLVAGVGNYPKQENDLVMFDLKMHFDKITELLSKIRKDITIIISPGNHDGVRLMEPQPMLDKQYAQKLYDMENVIVTTNPSQVNIGAKEDFVGFDVLIYHGVSYFYYANNIPFLVKQKAAHMPEIIMSYLLKNRHLAPTHGSMQYFPSGSDAHLIRKIPDIFVSGHTHKSGVCYYNNILVISVSSWEGKTPYQEKTGMTPDLCKVPLFNFKTRKVKILDFEDKEERK